MFFDFIVGDFLKSSILYPASGICPEKPILSDIPTMLIEKRLGKIGVN